MASVLILLPTASNMTVDRQFNLRDAAKQCPSLHNCQDDLELTAALALLVNSFSLLCDGLGVMDLVYAQPDD